MTLCNCIKTVPYAMKATRTNNVFCRLGRNILTKIHHNIKRNVYLQAFAITARKFCKDTSLHGLKYILGDPDTSSSYKDSKSLKALKALQKLITALIWSCVCIGLALFAITLMKLVYDKYQSTPIITVVDTNNYPIWNVDFPSVTVCNINKVNPYLTHTVDIPKQIIRNMLQVYAPATTTIINQLLEKGYSNQTITQFLHSLGKLIRPDYLNATFISLYATLEELGYNTETMMFELRQPCNRLLKQCFWLGKVVRCDHLFRTSRSSEGFCCSFNYKALKQYLETDNNTNSVEQVNSPILRVSGFGPFVGLSVTLQPEIAHYISDTKIVGTVIFVHGPFEYPDTRVSYVLGLLANDVNIAVVPHVVESSQAIRNLPMSKRKCYFPNELCYNPTMSVRASEQSYGTTDIGGSCDGVIHKKKLQVSAEYSFQGCMVDCVVEHIVEYCSCVPFYYPHSHLPKYKNNRQCNLRDVFCLREHQHIFASLRVPTVDLIDVNDTLFGMDCNCLPSCSEDVFEIETTICERPKKSKLRSLILGQSFDPENTTTLKIHFKDITCIKYRRELYLTWDGVFAAFGGIFSLCWGGSIISLFEFFYCWTFKFVEQIFEIQNEKLAEKQRYRHFVGINKDAKFKPIRRRNRNMNADTDCTDGPAAVATAAQTYLN